MNYVGRIFVGLIAILSIMFAMMAIMIYATHRNWREEITRTPAEVRGNQTVGWKYRYEELLKERAKVEDERDRYAKQAEAEKFAKIQALAKAEATINGLKTENDTLTQANTDLRANLAKATTTLEATQTNLSHSTDEVKKLRTDIAEAHDATDTQIRKATKLTDDLVKASAQLAVLTERNQQLATDVSKAKRMMATLGVRLEDPEDANTIRVAGKITEVSRNQVELSIGEHDGVRVGQNLDIYRGDKYVGRVRVVEIRPDQAVAAIEREYLQFPIQRGDNVASQL